ncbi:zinc-binding domain-containing protein, partial [Schizothecium vesticola]
HQTNLVATFRCPNPTCKGRRWPSGVVFTAIHAYHDNTYNATVYNQRCRACNTLGNIKLDVDVYVERVSYWLKKWAGVKMEPPHAEENKNTPLYEEEHCEGCKAGLCRRGRR